MVQMTRKYSNDEITVLWRPARCIHSGECLSLYKVFRPGRRPWVNMEGGTTEEIIRTVCSCPTGALTYTWNTGTDPAGTERQENPATDDESDPSSLDTGPDGPPACKAPGHVEIHIRPNGPLLISGAFRIFDAKGLEIPALKMLSICRCGQTGSPPFCDGSHFKYGFSDE